MTRPPSRWLESELPEPLSAVLSSAHGDASDAAIARVRARMVDALGPAFDATAGSVAPDEAPVREAAKALGSRSYWVGFGVIVAFIVGAWWSARPREPAHAPPAVADERQSQAPAPVVPEPQQPTPASALLEPQLQTREPAARAVVRAHKASSSRTLAPASQAERERDTAPAELGLAEELRQLTQIRQLLRTSAHEALLAADVHARRFPHGALGPERELLRIEALVRLGRSADAKRVAERARRASDSHPYRAQIEALLATPAPRP